MGMADMKRATVAAILALAPIAASAFGVGLNALSIHSQPGYESITPGAYVRSDGPLYAAGGIYRNSFGQPTVHAGIGYAFQVGRWDAGALVGGTYGYRKRQEWFYPDGSAPNFYTYGKRELRLMVAPSVGYRIGDEAVRLFVLPKVKDRTDTWVFSIAVERYF